MYNYILFQGWIGGVTIGEIFVFINFMCLEIRGRFSVSLFQIMHGIKRIAKLKGYQYFGEIFPHFVQLELS